MVACRKDREEFIKRALDRDLLFGGLVDKTLLDKAVDMRRDQATKDMDDVGDDLNLIVQLLLAAIRRGEQIKAVRARYALERPKNFGVYLTSYRQSFPNDYGADRDTMIGRMEDGVRRLGWKPDCSNVYGVFKWYFRIESHGNPGFFALYQPILDAFFSAPISS